MSYATYLFCECILFWFVFSVTLLQPLVPLFIYVDVLKASKTIGRDHNISETGALSHYGDRNKTLYCQYCDSAETNFHCVVTCNTPNAQHTAQQATGQIMLSVFVISEVVGVVTSIMWSRISDRRGRKLPMLASSIAQACFSLVLFVFIIEPSAKLRWYVIASYTLIALTGGAQGNFLIGTKSMITETSKVRNRTHRLAVNECVRALAQFLGFSLSGALQQLLGSPLLSFICTCSFTLLAIYCWLLPHVDVTTVTMLQFGIYTCKKRKLMLVFWLIVIGRVCFSAPDNIFVMFLLNFPDTFTSTLIGVFLGYNTLTFAIICFFYALMPSLTTGTSDTNMTGIGLALLMMAYTCFLLSSSMLSLFLGATLHGMYAFSTVSLNSILSKSLPDNQLAQTFATVKATERLLGCVFTPLISVTYQNTREVFLPGTCFLIPLILCCMTGVLLLVFLRKYDGQPDETIPIIQNPS